MFLKPSTCFLFLLPLIILAKAKASHLHFDSACHSEVALTPDTVPVPKCNNSFSIKHMPTADLFEPYEWLKKNRSPLDSGYACLSLSNKSVSKILLSDSAVMTLNKGCVCTLNMHSGNLAGLSGEAYLETKYHGYLVFVDDSTAICANAYSRLNIKSYKNSNLTISIIKGGFEMLQNRTHKSFDNSGRQLIFNSSGKLIREMTCDTLKVICWTRHAELLPPE